MLNKYILNWFPISPNSIEQKKVALQSEISIMETGIKMRVVLSYELISGFVFALFPLEKVDACQMGWISLFFGPSGSDM